MRLSSPLIVRPHTARPALAAARGATCAGHAVRLRMGALHRQPAPHS